MLADYTSTPNKITFVEEGTNVTFSSWTVGSSFTINEVTFGIGSVSSLVTALLKVKPPDKVSILGSMPADYQGRVVFIGDLSTRKFGFRLINVKRSDGNKYYGCDTFVTRPRPTGGSIKQLDWTSTQLLLLGMYTKVRVTTISRFISSLCARLHLISWCTEKYVNH